MSKKYFILILIICLKVNAIANTTPDFVFGNSNYFNLNIGETITFKNVEIQLVSIKNHYNFLKVKDDTIWVKVSRRSLPVISNGIRIFIADNRNVKSLTNDINVHGLLQKDALISLSEPFQSLLDQNHFVFPVSFNDGFLWNSEEDSYMFSYLGLSEGKGKGYYRSHEGIDIDLHDARGIEKHLLVALEKSTVVWVEDKKLDEAGKEACVLLESDSQPGIYYVYKNLYNKNVYVKKGDKLERGEAIGAIWGDQTWGHLHLSIVKSDTVPGYQNRYTNSINFFPQLYELYYKQTLNFYRMFSKGSIKFGQRRAINGNRKNVQAFEGYSGKGWDFGKWNIADKVQWVAKDFRGNARLKKVMFESEKAESKNPQNYFDYEICVRNGVYRIGANVGDLEKQSWQKVSFEGVVASTYNLNAGEFKWTPERVVKVKDGKLTVRIYVDETNIKVAGLSEIVFQNTY